MSPAGRDNPPWQVEGGQLLPDDTPKVSGSLGSLPNGTPLPGQKPVCIPGFKRCFGISWQKAAGDPNSKHRSKSIFRNESKTSVPRSSLGNKSFCQRSVNVTPRFLSGEVTSWQWSFSECSHSYLLQVNSSKLLHCWKGTLRASSKSQACGCSSSCDGLSPRDGQFLGMEVWCEACPLPGVWAEQLGTAGSLVPTSALHLWVPRRLWASVGGTRRFLGAGGLWLPHRQDHLQSPPHLTQAGVSHPAPAAQSSCCPLQNVSLSLAHRHMQCPQGRICPQP